MRGAALIALGVITGFLPAAAFPMWRACLPQNDFVGSYSLWTAMPGLQIQFDLAVSIIITVAAAAIGGFCGLSIERAIVDRKVARRLSLGCCPKCGYDLRGRSSEVCPECGATVAERRWRIRRSLSPKTRAIGGALTLDGDEISPIVSNSPNVESVTDDDGLEHVVK